MRNTLIIIFFLLVIAGSLTAYKAYQYLTEVRAHISKTEIELQRAQIEVAKHMNSLSTQNPHIKKLIKQFGGLGKDSQLSPEHITILATTLEMTQRLNFGANSNQKQLPSAPDIDQVLKGINQLRDLQNKLNQPPTENSPAISPLEQLVNSIHSFAKDSAGQEKE